MLITMIIIGVLAAGIAMVVIGGKAWRKTWSGAVFVTGVTLSILSGISVIIALILLIAVHAELPGNIEAHKVDYEALIYKQTTGTCRDEFGLLNKEYIDEVQEWNRKLVWNKALNKSIWANWYCPVAYVDVDVINLDDMVLR